METMYKIMDGKAEALEFKVCGSSAITQTALKDLALKPNTLIAGIIRGRKTIIPTGEDKIMPGDKVVVLAANRRLHDLHYNKAQFSFPRLHGEKIPFGWRCRLLFCRCCFRLRCRCRF